MNCLWPKKSKQHVLRNFKRGSLQLLQVLQKTHLFEATTSTMEPGVSQYTNTSSWCWLVLRETLAISNRFFGIINPGLDLNVCHESEQARSWLGRESDVEPTSTRTACKTRKLVARVLLQFFFYIFRVIETDRPMDPSDASWVLVTTLTALDRELLWASQILQGYRIESEYADMSLLMSLLDFQTCRKAFSVFTLSNDRTSGSPPSRSPDECRPNAVFLNDSDSTGIIWISADQHSVALWVKPLWLDILKFLESKWSSQDATPEPA